MCWANATLFYGLWVTTASLNFAATAHQATRDPVLAIDLIVARRRAGKLEVEGQGARTTARDLPEEVWEMVKQALRDVEIRQAEEDTLDELRCGGCHAEEMAKPGNLTYEQRHDWSSWSTPGCDITVDNVMYSEINCNRGIPTLQDVETLLRAYGLNLPSEEMWHEDSAQRWADSDSLSAIALPAGSAHEETTQVTAECDHDTLSSGSSTMRLAHEHFHVPTNAHLHFRRLIRDYRLQVVDRTMRTIVPVDLPTRAADEALTHQRSSTLGSKRGAALKLEEVKPIRFAEDEPRWMLWSLCEPCP